MKKKKLAKGSEEFDRRFDSGEDIHDLIDLSRARVIHHGKKVRITLDISESLVKEIDEIRKQIGVDRGTLISEQSRFILFSLVHPEMPLIVAAPPYPFASWLLSCSQ